MARTLEQPEALNKYANAVAQHILRQMEARENPDSGFKQGAEKSFRVLEECRKKLRDLGTVPLFWRADG